MISRRRFLAGLAVVGGLAGIGARPKEAKKMAFELVGVGYAGDSTTYRAENAAGLIVTVPEGEFWKVKNLFGGITTTVAAGNRFPQVILLNTLAAGSMFEKKIQFATAVPASQLVYLNAGQELLSASVAIAAGVSVQTIPTNEFWAPPGFQFWIKDEAAVAVGTDTYILTVGYEIYKWVP